MSVPPLPVTQSGRLIVIGTIWAKDGEGDRLQQLLTAVRKVGESDSEPKTLTYRTTRGIGEDSNVFSVFEEYLTGGLEEHCLSKEIQDLLAADVVAKMDIKYSEEYQ